MVILGSAAIEPLSWKIRLKIAIGAARGLAFLHSLDKKIIYRDFKASNILLDGVSVYIILTRILWLSYLFTFDLNKPFKKKKTRKRLNKILYAQKVPNRLAHKMMWH